MGFGSKRRIYTSGSPDFRAAREAKQPVSPEHQRRYLCHSHMFNMYLWRLARRRREPLESGVVGVLAYERSVLYR